MWLVSYPSVWTCVLGAQKNRLIETLLLSTHNVCFGWGIKKKNFQLHTLIWGPVLNIPTSNLKTKLITVNVLKFWTLVTCPKGLDKQVRPRSDCFWRSRLIRVCPVCYSDKQFVNSSPDYHHLVGNRKRNVFEVLEHLPYLKKFNYKIHFTIWWGVEKSVGIANSVHPDQIAP